MIVHDHCCAGDLHGISPRVGSGRFGIQAGNGVAHSIDGERQGLEPADAVLVAVIGHCVALGRDGDLAFDLHGSHRAPVVFRPAVYQRTGYLADVMVNAHSLNVVDRQRAFIGHRTDIGRDICQVFAVAVAGIPLVGQTIPLFRRSCRGQRDSGGVAAAVENRCVVFGVLLLGNSDGRIAVVLNGQYKRL